MQRSSTRRRPARRTPAPRRARGMTLVEVLVALTIFGVALLGMARYSMLFSRSVNDIRWRSRAGQLAVNRLEQVKAGAVYDSIDAWFARKETAIPDAPGFTRTTLVQRTGGAAGDSVDFRTITVLVTAPGLKDTVRKTTIIANF